LAAHESGIDDSAGGEGAHEAGDAHLTEVGVDLHLGEDRAVRIHRPRLDRLFVARHAARADDDLTAGAGEDVDVAFAAALVVAAMQAAPARDDADVAGPEQWR